MTAERSIAIATQPAAMKVTSSVSCLSLFLAPASGFVPVKQSSSFPLNQCFAGGKMTQLAAAGPEIEMVSQPDNEFLEKKGVFSWGTWGCGASKLPWSYDSNESCYLLAGQVTVTPTDDREPATFGKEISSRFLLV
jgi:uncharacterized cupin superfamily protein